LLSDSRIQHKIIDSLGPRGGGDWAEEEDPFSELPVLCLRPVLKAMTDAERRASIDAWLMTELDRVLFARECKVLRRMYGPKGRDVDYRVPWVAVKDPLSFDVSDDEEEEEET
jgi:hypothetical protein